MAEQSAKVTVTGTAKNPVFNFDIPVGAKGERGPQGPGFSNAIPITAGTSFNSYINPGIYSWENTAATDGPPVASPYGTMIVTRSTSGARLTQTFYPASSGIGNRATVFYQRIQLPGVVTPLPWVCYASQRVDNTAGRVVYTWDDTANREQMIYGDTGERNITTDLQGVASGSAYIRRLGNDVYLTLISVAPSAPQATHNLLPTIPVGFRGSLQRNMYLKTGILTNAEYRSFVYGTSLTAYESKVSDLYRHTFIFPTNDSWPTILPGTAVGTIPNL